MATTDGPQPNVGFFSNAIKNRLALTPGAAHLLKFANKMEGQGGAVALNSRVLVSSQNGSGPAVAPVTAPWSFTEFATGQRSLILKGIAARRRK